jgi:pimeloyl-ACP methyl ester carboxylesterase
MGERLHAEGVHVLGLRYPGHGTAPASLTRTSWEDMYGAVALAARHLAQTLPDTPLYVFGYSTGGPLAVELSLRALGDDSVPLPDGLVLFSPAMGITPLAALTPWQARLGRLLGFEKMAWNSIELEYDPYKYRSFPLNAALQVWRLANHVDAGVASAAAAGVLGGFPPTLSFQSVVDNTIEVPAIVHSLYDRLPESSAESEHALVIYDFNRSTEVELLLTSDPRAALNALLQDDARRYAFTVVSNTSEDSRAVLATTGPRSGRERMVCVLDALWPQGTYSLSHIAPTFPPDDPLYGGAEAKPYDGISLGNVVLRGEAGALRVSAAGFLRQTFNPFFDYQLGRIRGFMNLAGPPPCSLPGG